MNLTTKTTTRAYGAEEWQTLQMIACSTLEIVLQVKEILQAVIPKSSQFCQIVALDRCVDVDTPIDFPGIEVIFSATDNVCRDTPLILKKRSNGINEVEINVDAGTATIKIVSADTCCMRAKVRELFFTIFVIDNQGIVQAQAQGALVITPNAMGATLAGAA